MIRLETILTPGRSLVNAPGGSKKKALEQIANLISKQVPELEMQDVYEALIAREKLARPVLVTASPFLTAASKAARHLSAPCCTWTLPSISTPSTVPRSTCCSCLLVPQAATDAHLELLRQIASMLDRKEVRDKLRSASSNEALYQVVLAEQNEQ